MEVGVAAAPVGDLGEGVSGQDVLRETTGSRLVFFSCGKLYFIFI